MCDLRFKERGRWMSVSEDEGMEFHDRDGTGEIHDFCVSS